MGRKSFNPLVNPHDALQYLLLITPPENRQQAIRAASVVKARLDEQRNDNSEVETLRGQNAVLLQQITALQAEITALQFVPEPEPEKKRGRKAQVENG
jgi:hypothetical protein